MRDKIKVFYIWYCLFYICLAIIKICKKLRYKFTSKGDYRSLGNNEISDEYFGDELVETPVTLNDTWGYKSYDNNWKSAEKIYIFVIKEFKLTKILKLAKKTCGLNTARLLFY